MPGGWFEELILDGINGIIKFGGRIAEDRPLDRFPIRFHSVEFRRFFPQISCD
jgi:hypothetical protein